ncbi:MAG TPA: hypothetical protein VFY88_02700 [Intrasporangium sp.]|nr:hypothetical protein [Intrasporangium sp.]
MTDTAQSTTRPELIDSLVRDRCDEPADRLVIAYCFTPYVDTSGTVMAKRVRLLGEPVDVIQNEMSTIRGIDPGVEAVAGDRIRRRAVLPTPTHFSSWPSIREWCEAGQAKVDQWVGDSGGTAPWRSMYSRSHFVASHYLAALVKDTYPDIEWEAEFSDPCSRDANGAVRFAPVEHDALLRRVRSAVGPLEVEPDVENVFAWAEHLVWSRADRIVFTNANQLEYMIGLIPDPQLRRRARERAAVAHHPTLPPRFYELDRADQELETDRINIGYFGNFDGKQSPVDVVRGISALDMNLRRRLALHIYTNDTEKLDEYIEALDVADCVRAHPFLPFLQFLELSTRMDLLLIVDHPLATDADNNPFLPPKWGDFAGSGTPVWGLLEESSVLSAMDPEAIRFRTPIEQSTAAAQLLSQLARGVITL